MKLTTDLKERNKCTRTRADQSSIRILCIRRIILECVLEA